MKKTTKVDEAKVREYVEDFKLEYPNYDSEIIEAYLEVCDDFNAQERSLFLRLLNY